MKIQIPHEERLHAIECDLDQLKRELNIQRRSSSARVLDFIRHEYGFITFILLGLAAGYYAVRYQVTPFHDLADPARSSALSRTYTTIGDRMMATGHWDHARVAFDEALKLDPRNAQASYHAHVARLLMIDVPTVIDGALAQLANADDDAVILFARGIVCTRRRQYTAAAELFRRSIEADPTFVGSRIHLGVVSLWLGDNAAYRKQAAEAYRLDSGFSVAINNMGYACELRHDFREATRLYLRMDTLERTAMTEWLVGSSMLYHAPAAAERYLGDCVKMLDAERPDTTAEFGGTWQVGYAPMSMDAQLSEEDVVPVTERREKLGCALASYALCDALAYNVAGADAKLSRAETMLASNRRLLRIVALEIRSVAELGQCDSTLSDWLQRAATRIMELQ